MQILLQVCKSAGRVYATEAVEIFGRVVENSQFVQTLAQGASMDTRVYVDVGNRFKTRLSLYLSNKKRLS